jgi:hypothetical protein
MGQSPSSGPGERVTTEKDRAETITPCHITIVGTTNYPAQREISRMGSPSYQTPVQPPLFLENSPSYSQKTWTSHSDKGKTPAIR